MSKRKRRKGFLDLFNFDEEDFLLGQEPIEGGSGYSISVTYDEEIKPVVRVKTHGDIDVTKLRKDIEQRYPEARIEGLEKQQLIRVVDEKEEKKKTELEKKKEKKERFSIRVAK